MLRIFSPEKSESSARFEPADLGVPEASMLTTRPGTRGQHANN
jgi:hypothetical protein